MQTYVQMIPRKINEFSFEKYFETLKELPVNEYEYKPIEWVKISSLSNNLPIFLLNKKLFKIIKK